MVQASDFRSGMAIDLEGELYWIVECQHVQPGKGGAFVRTKLKSVKTGRIVDRTFRAEERIQDVRIERKPMQFIYRSESQYYFMDTETYEQYPIDEAQVQEAARFLKEGDEVEVLFTRGAPIGIELPYFVELKVVETEPGVKGDTVSGATKPATLETGAVVQVPLFIEEGDVIKIDTRTGEYVERV